MPSTLLQTWITVTPILVVRDFRVGGRHGGPVRGSDSVLSCIRGNAFRLPDSAAHGYSVYCESQELSATDLVGEDVRDVSMVPTHL